MTGPAETLLKILIPILVVCILLAIWQVGVWVSGVPQYILPGPIAIAGALVKDWGTLSPALWVTTKITLMSLGLALIGGVGIAVALVQSKWIEVAFYPITVILQVTPIVAIAPLILIYSPPPRWHCSSAPFSSPSSRSCPTWSRV